MEPNMSEDGYSIDGWVNTLGYTAPSPVTANPFRFVMDEDRKIRGQMREHFRLRKIAFYRGDATSMPTWYRAKALRGGHVDDANIWLAEDGGNAIHYGTRTRLLFNDPVDLATLAYGLYATDHSERIDYPEVGSIEPWTRLTYMGTPSNIPTTANGNREIVFDLMRNGAMPGLPRGEEFQLAVSDNIRNTSSERLWNDHVYNAISELPGVQIQLDSVAVRGMAGDLLERWPEPYTIYNAALSGQTAMGREPGDQYPPTISPYSVVAYGPGGGPLMLLEVEHPRLTDVAQLGLLSYDYDGTGGVDSRYVQNASDGTALFFGLVTLGLLVGAAITSSIIVGTLAAVAALVAGIFTTEAGPAIWEALTRIFGAVFANADDTMGNYVWNYSWRTGEWFGGHPSKYWEQHRPNTNNDIIGYDVDFKLKK
jgi:hypothetical protein